MSLNVNARYKAQWYGNRIDIIDQWFPSSKNCCQCGHKKEELKLSDRIYECSNCGLKIDRDLNASINLANAEDDVIVESIGWVTPESTRFGQYSPEGTGRSKKQTL